MSKITIELDGGKNNGNPMVLPLGETYRGRHLKGNLSPSQKFSPHNQSMPDVVPGFYVEVDLRAKTVTVYDPLTRPQFKRERAALEHYLAHPMEDGVRKQRFTPLEDKVMQLRDDEVAMEWLSWMWRVVNADTPHAILHAGEFPEAVTDYVRAEQRRYAAMRGGGRTKVPELLSA